MPNIRMDIEDIESNPHQNDPYVAEIAAFFVCLFNKNTGKHLKFFHLGFISLKEKHLEITQFCPSLTLHKCVIDS